MAQVTTQQLIQRMKHCVAIAKRDPEQISRDSANTELHGIYAELALRQKAGDPETNVAIDFGAL